MRYYRQICLLLCASVFSVPATGIYLQYVNIFFSILVYFPIFLNFLLLRPLRYFPSLIFLQSSDYIFLQKLTLNSFSRKLMHVHLYLEKYVLKFKYVLKTHIQVKDEYGCVCWSHPYILLWRMHLPRTKIFQCDSTSLQLKITVAMIPILICQQCFNSIWILLNSTGRLPSATYSVIKGSTLVKDNFLNRKTTFNLHTENSCLPPM